MLGVGGLICFAGGDTSKQGKQGKSRETGEIKGNRGIQGEIRNPGETRVSL